MSTNKHQPDWRHSWYDKFLPALYVAFFVLLTVYLLMGLVHP